jgi:hypothetical protein
MILKGEALEMINSVTDKRGKHVSKNRSCGDRESNSITLWENYGVQAIKRLMVTEITGSKREAVEIESNSITIWEKTNP